MKEHYWLSALNMHKIDKSKILEEINTTIVKVRWDRRSQDWLSDPDTAEDDPLTQEELQEKDKLQDAEARLIYKSDSDSIDLGSRRATDMVHNKRLHLPQPNQLVRRQS